MASLRLQRIVKRYDETMVIHGIDLDVRDGEFVVFVGPSGCGKSTLLRMIAGLESVSEGELLIDGKRVNDISAAQRGLAMVFQSYALYPHMTVYQNLAFGLENQRMPRAEIDAKVQDAARMLRLEPLLARRPTQLSGGQRQRVAIGRAIVRDPTIFLFDEPLSNLDAELRVQMRAEISRLHQRLGTTMIYVTHDQVEAMTMADRIVVLRGGCVEQVGTPLDLYNRPANRFVAGFIGSPQMNFLGGSVASVDDAHVTVTLDAAAPDAPAPALPMRAGAVSVGQRVWLGIRPEHLVVGAAPAAAQALTVTIDRIEQLGGASFLYCSLPGGDSLTVHAAGQVAHTAGTPIAVYLPVDDLHIFASTEGELALTRR
ncbi:MAG TPA: sn-glycerol-3-phosphate ABC transporter ATP-binding protein UgpC [Casimicrobiaceae bacterium]|jgi:multiple sugar transport system ATP-binding protein